MVSAAAKDLVQNMLLFSPQKRYSAKECLDHKWLQQHTHTNVDINVAKSLLHEMRTFSAHHKLQQAALTYMVSQLTTKQEKEQLEAVFLALDRSGNGRLSTDELVSGFKEVYGEGFPAEEEVLKIMQNIDMDKNGSIDYTEFVIATIDKNKLLSRERLVAAFKMFDTVIIE